ncbi:MAG: Ppx/GppA family phosphatase [Moorellaceae bacterium]
MSVYAALDIGSNSVRLLVGEVEKGRVRPLLQKLKSTRLMAGFREGRLAREALERTCLGAKELVELARTFPLAGMTAVATSAAREARNADLFLRRLETLAGIPVKIISGEEEACLTYRGARAGLDAGPAEILVVDVGGGSTEFSWEEGDNLNLRSVPLGAVRCTEAAMTAAEIKLGLEPVLEEIRRQAPGRIIATGGTATTLAALEQGLTEYRSELVHGFTLRRDRIAWWREYLAALPMEKRRRLAGLQPERADIIVAGVTIIAAVLEGLRAEALTVSEADLLWGLLLAAAEEGVRSVDMPGRF